MGIFSNSSTFDGLVGKLLLPCILYEVEISELKILSQKQSNIISLARVFHNAQTHPSRNKSFIEKSNLV